MNDTRFESYKNVLYLGSFFILFFIIFFRILLKVGKCQYFGQLRVFVIRIEHPVMEVKCGLTRQAVIKYE